MKMRVVHIDNQEWQWKYIRSRIVIISPDGKKYPAYLTEVTGWDWEGIEKAQWKGSFTVTPSQVKNYIINNLIKQESDEKN